MKYVTIGARVVLGLIFFASGVAFFGGFYPKELPPGDMGVFVQGLAASKYFMPFLKVTELVCGALLIAGFWVPLALIILAPIVINIFLVHAVLAPEGIIVAIVILALQGFVAWTYRAHFKGVLAKK